MSRPCYDTKDVRDASLRGPAGNMRLLRGCHPHRLTALQSQREEAPGGGRGAVGTAGRPSTGRPRAGREHTGMRDTRWTCRVRVHAAGRRVLQELGGGLVGRRRPERKVWWVFLLWLAKLDPTDTLTHTHAPRRSRTLRSSGVELVRGEFHKRLDERRQDADSNTSTPPSSSSSSSPTDP